MIAAAACLVLSELNEIEIRKRVLPAWSQSVQDY